MILVEQRDYPQPVGVVGELIPIIVEGLPADSG